MTTWPHIGATLTERSTHILDYAAKLRSCGAVTALHNLSESIAGVSHTHRIRSLAASLVGLSNANRALRNTNASTSWLMSKSLKMKVLLRLTEVANRADELTNAIRKSMRTRSRDISVDGQSDCGKLYSMRCIASHVRQLALLEGNNPQAAISINAMIDEADHVWPAAIDSSPQAAEPLNEDDRPPSWETVMGELPTYDEAMEKRHSDRP